MNSNFTNVELTKILREKFKESYLDENFLIEEAPFNQLFESSINPKLSSGDLPRYMISLVRVQELIPKIMEKYFDGDAILEEIEKEVELFLRKYISNIDKHDTTNFFFPLLTHRYDHIGIISKEKLSLQDLHNSINRILIQACKSSRNTVLLNTQTNPENEIEWYDNVKDILFSQPLNSSANQKIAQHVYRQIQTIEKKVIKLIVLDCDNTIWGGVLGEDGPEALEMSYGFPGEIYGIFQQQLKNLRKSGVMLAICSKNNEFEVLEMFNNHKKMILKQEDIATIKANWRNKSSNISDILNLINVLPENTLFIDDLKFELDEVLEQFPNIQSCQVPKNIEDLPKILSNFNFEVTSHSLTKEDRARTSMMKAEETRRKELNSNTFQHYLESLSLKLRIEKLGADDKEKVSRFHQLVNKTNQFNFTTIRLNSNEIQELLNSDRTEIFLMSAEDKYGDYGITGAVILEKIDKHNLMVQNYLLSCRVLGRGIEDTFLTSLMIELSHKGFKRVKINFKESAKNMPALDYAKKFHANNEVDIDMFAQAGLKNSALSVSFEVKS